MIPLWLNLEVTHVVSAWSHWSEALYMHLAGGGGGEPGRLSPSFRSGCSGYPAT